MFDRYFDDTAHRDCDPGQSGYRDPDRGKTTGTVWNGTTKVGCEFISDLPYHSGMVKKVLHRMDLEKYTTLDLQDLFWYVFKVHLHSKKDMIEFLKKEE